MSASTPQSPTVPQLTGPPLEGRLVRLEPLGHQHAADLAVAAEEDRRSYAYTWVPRAAEVTGYIDAQLARAAAGKLAPYAIIEKISGRAVGATAYWDPRPWPDGRGLSAIEIGFSWLTASAQGTGINSEAKLLLLDHAFTVFGVARVDLKTDARNARSQAAIQAIGGTLERVLRRWSVILGARRGRPVAGFGDLLLRGRGMARSPRPADRAAQ